MSFSTAILPVYWKDILQILHLTVMNSDSSEVIFTLGSPFLMPNFRVPLRDVDRCVSLMLKKSPSFLDTKLDSNDAKWKETVPFSYSLSSSLHSGDLHSMMSLFPIIPLEAPPAKRCSLPTFRPCQSNLSNLSKGQRPDRSSCIPIKLNTIEM